MAEKPERIGFGEPLVFEGPDADIICRILEQHVLYPGVIKDLSTHQRLLEVAVPPLEICESTRGIIHEGYNATQRVDIVPGVDTPEYEAFDAKMSGIFDNARAAFNNRSVGCEMRNEGDDCYVCTRCMFDQTLDVHI